MVIFATESGTQNVNVIGVEIVSIATMIEGTENCYECNSDIHIVLVI